MRFLLTNFFLNVLIFAPGAHFPSERRRRRQKILSEPRRDPQNFAFCTVNYRVNAKPVKFDTVIYGVNAICDRLYTVNLNTIFAYPVFYRVWRSLFFGFSPILEENSCFASKSSGWQKQQKTSRNLWASPQK